MWMQTALSTEQSLWPYVEACVHAASSTTGRHTACKVYGGGGRKAEMGSRKDLGAPLTV